MKVRGRIIDVREFLDEPTLEVLVYTISRVYHVDEENVIFDGEIFKEVIEDYLVSKPYYKKYSLDFFECSLIVELFAPEESASRLERYAWPHFR